MLSVKTLRAVPSTGVILCGVGFGFGDWIARHPLEVFLGACALLGFALMVYSATIRLVLLMRGY